MTDSGFDGVNLEQRQGLMQQWPLTVNRIIDHAARWHGNVEVVSRISNGGCARSTYSEVKARAERLSGALHDIGVRPGDCVATLAWNNLRHLEAWYGIMGMGAVCHTLNPRLFADHLEYIINIAEDRVIIVEDCFLSILENIQDKLKSVNNIIILSDDGISNYPNLRNTIAYEDIINNTNSQITWGDFDENIAAGLCFTSGTTGLPKGVLYSHRSNFLHAIMCMTPDVFGISSSDVIMPIVPMFHANAWGLTFTAPAAGAKLVFPGSQLDGASVYELLETEAVTFSAAVPTVWQSLLTFLRDTGSRLSTLQRMVVGGAALPEHILRSYQDDFGIRVVQAWGMTEMSPVGTVSTLTPGVEKLDKDQKYKYSLKQGRSPLCVDMEIFNDNNEPLPHDGNSMGYLKVRGPWVANSYINSEDDILDDNGYFNTGDVSTIDNYGFMHIVDRSKDIIKSGGEWISSIEIENIIAGHPEVVLCAVVAKDDAKWGERPILIIEAKDESSKNKDTFLSFLSDKVAKWWIPDEIIFVDKIPIGSTGKIDKKAIRNEFADR